LVCPLAYGEPRDVTIPSLKGIAMKIMDTITPNEAHFRGHHRLRRH
jgi:hypothetical protein